MTASEITRKCLVRLIASATKSLSMHGFQESPEIEDLERVRFVLWKKHFSWRIHAVRLWHRIGDEQFVGVSLQVLLPREIQGDPHLFDQVEVGSFLGHPGSYHPLPRFADPLGIFCKVAIRKIVQDLELAIPWFSGYASAQACLSKLNSGDTMHGVARGPMYQEMNAYLQKLIAEGNR